MNNFVKKTPLRVGVVGLSGYSGFTALKILLNHPQVRVTYVAANTTEGRVSDIWPALAKQTRLYCERFDAERAASLCDVVFLAVPHAVSMTMTPDLLKRKVRVIDLSGDYRLASAAAYKKWYGKKHTDPRWLSTAVYGLPEIFRTRIAEAPLIANPGCYPTAAILGLAPLVGLHREAIANIVIDAKSGVSGAGKKVDGSLMFCETNESFKAYKVLGHQHTPEIAQYLGRIAGGEVNVVFTPHLVPMNNGIFETIYVVVKEGQVPANIPSLYKKFYKTEPFVRVLQGASLPEIKHVVGTNFCDIAVRVDASNHVIIIMSAIDNLIKGAAGQAIQNMNIMFGLPETMGLLNG